MVVVAVVAAAVVREKFAGRILKGQTHSMALVEFKS